MELEKDSLLHYGTPRHSGRYPWGSGDSTYQRSKGFLGQVQDYRDAGMSDTEIAHAMGMSSGQFRSRISSANVEERAARVAMVQRLKDKGMSNTAIGRKLDIPESTVRSLLNPTIKKRQQVLNATTDMLKDAVKKQGLIDIGAGVELNVGVSKEKLKAAVAKLQDEEGYTVHYVKVPQIGSTDKFTTVKVLAPPDMSYSDVLKNKGKIREIGKQFDESTNTYLDIAPPKALDSKRVMVRFGEEGTKRDGTIEIRPDAPADVSLGGALYAQVRVAVDGTHYLKGMAMYGNPKEFPKGVDVIFNSNKDKSVGKLGAMKPFKDDPENPFGAITHQKYYIDKNGKRQQSVLNIVREEGEWADWSKNLPSQMLSKQLPALAKQQLDLDYKHRYSDYDAIMNLTNAAVRKKLLMDFAESSDAAAVELKGAAMPRQSVHAILPIPSMKSNEIYAPNYRDGESVVLVRFPHGGIFEIPELKVNNRQPKAKKLLKNAKDAVGINEKVAERLSGADFDGDFVLVIPNNRGSVRTSPALKGLKNFNPSDAYPAYEGMAKVGPKSGFNKQRQMGSVSNLITDMTIKGANQDELACAVRHSMVVIDAEKHNLNWRQSAIDNRIAALKTRYQGGANKGASTIISKASSEARPLARRPRRASEGGPIDPKTGEKRWTDTGDYYIKKTTNPRTGKITETKVMRTTVSTKMAETRDARTLSSGTAMEKIYANHANKLKSMANTARKQVLATDPIKTNPKAKKQYKTQVDTLRSKLKIAERNAPLERKAQIIANEIVNVKRKANPDMEKDEYKKIQRQALATARSRTGASKTQIYIEDDEWDAIQHGAVSNSFLTKLLDNAEPSRVRELATPMDKPALSTSKIAWAKSLLAAGNTQSDVAEMLGVSASTLNKAMK